MTVAELIAKLSEFDGSLTVYSYGKYGEYDAVVEVSDFIAYEDDEEESEIKAVFVG